MPTPRRDPWTRFIQMIEMDTSTNCWLWQGGRGWQGYGRFWTGERTMAAHKWSWEWRSGPVPDGLQLDHLCRNRACVNPDHLEPVAPRENVMRSPITVAAVNAAKTECIKGHRFSTENTYITNRGTRHCRACQRARSAAHKAKKKEMV